MGIAPSVLQCPRTGDQEQKAFGPRRLTAPIAQLEAVSTEQLWHIQGHTRGGGHGEKSGRGQELCLEMH